MGTRLLVIGVGVAKLRGFFSVHGGQWLPTISISGHRGWLMSQSCRFNSSSFAKNTTAGAGRRAAKTRPNSR